MAHVKSLQASVALLPWGLLPVPSSSGTVPLNFARTSLYVTLSVYVSLPHGDLGWPLEEKPAVPCGLGFSLHWRPGALGQQKE